MNNIEDYIHGFYGFGNWDRSKIWYIGIEERGGDTVEDVNNRIKSWMGKKEDLLDNEKHQRDIGNSHLYTKGTLQSTWRPLIRLRQGYEGKPIDIESIREIQKYNWGHLDSDNLLIELLPLPSPKNDIWKYKNWLKIDYLQSRNRYEKYIAPRRIDYIKSKIDIHKPELVVFYTTSKKYAEYWEKLVDGKAITYIIDKYKTNYNIQIFNKNSTCFVQVPHPNGVRGIPIKEFWKGLGEMIKAKCKLD